MLKTLKLIKAWIVEFFRPCPGGKPAAQRKENFLICGHRGSPVKEVENTIKSFERALNEGANSLETDLCLTKDNEVVLWHDWNPNGVNALLRESGFEPWVKYKPLPPSLLDEFRKPVNEVTLKELRENFFYKKRKRYPRIANVNIPTLREFFEWSCKQKRLKYIFFDIKTPGDLAHLSINILNCVTEFAEELKPEYQIIIETTEPEVLKILKEKFPQYNFCLDIDSNPGFILNPEDYSAVKAAIKYGNNFAMAFRPQKVTIANWTTYRRIVQFDSGLRDKYNTNNPAKKINLIGCTVNKRKELRCLFRLGIDGIQTDYPGRLKRIVQPRKIFARRKKLAGKELLASE